MFGLNWRGKTAGKGEGMAATDWGPGQGELGGNIVGLEAQFEEEKLKAMPW